MNETFIITCEHADNTIPTAYASLFEGLEAELNSHQGYDAGALLMAQALAHGFDGELVSANTSRLLVDLNRSIGHPRIFSPATRALTTAKRNQILDDHYRPFRLRVEGLVTQAQARDQRVIHVSSHSFTPVLNDTVRTADIGLLYDPRRAPEAALCARWKAALGTQIGELRVRRNYPYVGKGDGLTSYLRQRFPSNTYIGIELEVNQAIVFGSSERWAAVRNALVETLKAACYRL